MERNAIILCIGLLISSQVLANDTVGEVVRQRPDKVNTSTTAASSKGVFTASYRVKNAERQVIPLNTIHSWQLHVNAQEGTSLSGLQVQFSSTMPEHLHGMTTKPKISSTGSSGQYLMEGMNFHMPGWWEITLKLSNDGVEDFVHFNLLVGEGEHRHNNNKS